MRKLGSPFGLFLYKCNFVQEYFVWIFVCRICHKGGEFWHLPKPVCTLRKRRRALNKETLWECRVWTANILKMACAECVSGWEAALRGMLLSQAEENMGQG